MTQASYTVNCGASRIMSFVNNSWLFKLTTPLHSHLRRGKRASQRCDYGFATMLNPNDDNRNRFTFGDYVIDIDFKRHTFMFATTEADKLFHALQDRCTRIDLEDYNYDELGAIVALSLKRVSFQDGVLPEIASTLRGNARAAKKVAVDIASYIKGKIAAGELERSDSIPWTCRLGLLKRCSASTLSA